MARRDTSCFSVIPDAVNLEEYFLLQVNGETVIQKQMTGTTKRVPREFKTFDDAVGFGASLLATGHIKYFGVLCYYRLMEE